MLDSFGYKLAGTQRELTPLQRLVLLYGYACYSSQASSERKEMRPLEDLVNLLPRR